MELKLLILLVGGALLTIMKYFARPMFKPEIQSSEYSEYKNTYTQGEYTNKEWKYNP